VPDQAGSILAALYRPLSRDKRSFLIFYQSDTITIRLTTAYLHDIFEVKPDRLAGTLPMYLERETNCYQATRERLLASWPELDSETLADTLEGITSLHEMIGTIIRSALVDEALEAGLRLRLDDMKHRMSRLEERAAKKRQLALDAMNKVGISKLEQSDFTASVRAGSAALVVIDEETIPEGYWLPLPPMLDRQAILRELKQGAEIPGAQLSNPKPVLMVRTK
jgi:Siphovirus Gp157